MSTRVAAAWVLFGVALSLPAAAKKTLPATTKPPGASTNTSTTGTTDLTKPSECTCSLLDIQKGLQNEKEQESARKKLVDQLACLRKEELADKSPAKNEERATEIKTLEGLAIDDAQRLSDLIPALEKAEDSGVSVGNLLSATRQAIISLSSIVVVAEGKAGLKPGRFTKYSADLDTQKKRQDCEAAEQLSLPEATDVQRCVEVLSEKISKAGDYGDSSLRRRLEFVEDIGTRLAKDKGRQLAQLPQKRDAAKTPADKDAVDKLQKQVEQDLAVLNDIAVVPASRRSCLKIKAIRDLADADGVTRCLRAIDDKIKVTKIEHQPPPHEHAGRVAVLRFERAQIEDERIRFNQLDRVKKSLEKDKERAHGKEAVRLQEKIDRIQLEMPNIVVVNNAPAGCGGGSVCQLPIARDQIVMDCLAAIDREIGIADERRAEWAAKLDGELDQYRQLREAVEDRGSNIADDRGRDVADLAEKITAAKDDATKAPLVALQSAATAEIKRLEKIATVPSTERRCVDDPGFEPKDASSAARCMIIVSNRIESTKIANPIPRDPAVVSLLAQLHRQLSLLAFASRHIAAEVAVAPAVTTTDPAGDAKKADVKIATAQAAPSDSTIDVKALTALAMEPLAREACVGDPNSVLKVADGVYVARCVAALTAAIEDLEQGREEEPMDDGERKETIRHLTKQLGNFQAAGRVLLTQANAKMAALQAKHDATQDDADRAKIDDSEKPLTAQITALKTVVIEQGTDPQTGFADYDQWFTKLSLGYEYAGATTAFSKGFPRIGATIGFHYPGQTAADLLSGWHAVGYGLYNTFTAWLTNSAESQTDLAGQFVPAASMKRIRALDGEGDPTTTTTTTPATPAPVTRALEFEDQFFMPFWRNGFLPENPRLRTVIGPLIVFGARKLDTESFAHDRFYIGLRNARSPDTFYDLLYGRTGGLVSRRIEFRGQYSLPYIFKNNARINVGAVGNFGINKRRFLNCEEGAPHCRQEEPDSIRFYLSYDIGGNDFLKFFGAKAPSP